MSDTPRALGDRLFDGVYAESELEDELDNRLGNIECDMYERTWHDHYDRSLELGGCKPDLRLSPAVQSWLWEQGFLCCFLNHTDNMQTLYTRPGTAYYGETPPEGRRFPQTEHGLRRGEFTGRRRELAAQAARVTALRSALREIEHESRDTCLASVRHLGNIARRALIIDGDDK